MVRLGHVRPSFDATRRSPRRSWSTEILALAAAASLVVGTWVGHFAFADEAPEPTHALLLYEGEAFEPMTDANYPARFGDYNEWIAGLRPDDQFVTGLQFHEDAVQLGPVGRVEASSTGEPRLSAMFLVAARDSAEALRLARDLPHLRYGGEVAVRELVPVATPTEAAGG